MATMTQHQTLTPASDYETVRAAIAYLSETGPDDTQRSLLVSAMSMARQVRSLAHAYREPVTIVGESEGALVARAYLLDLYRPASRFVDRLITLDMPSGASAVYFPPRGRDGWGVASEG